MSAPPVTTLLWLPNILLALHILAAAAWVGGMLYALVVLRPALRVLEPAARLQIQLITLKRFFLVVWHAMPIMLLTGWAMIGAIGWSMALLPWYERDAGAGHHHGGGVPVGVFRPLPPAAPCHPPRA